MHRYLSHTYWWKYFIFALSLFGTIIWAAMPSVSDDFTDRRISTGTRIFRALLAADQDLGQKAKDCSTLKICLIYDTRSNYAEMAAKTFQQRKGGQIRDLTLHVEILSFSEYLKRHKTHPQQECAAVFLTQILNDKRLKRLIEIINSKKIVLFSPLEGDVERGVQSGISIEAQVRPYLNVHALKDADIHLKSFFIRVAKQYE